jgi:hypothetical protein
VPNRTASILSGLLTAVILILLAILSVFMQMVMLNGVSEPQGLSGMSISLLCQGISLSLAVIFSRWLSNLLMVKFNLNALLAVLIAVIVSTGLGGLISFLSIIVAIPLAEIG